MRSGNGSERNIAEIVAGKLWPSIGTLNKTAAGGSIVAGFEMGEEGTSW